MFRFTALCWITFVASLILQQSAKAILFSDRDRVLVTFNSQTDLCNGLTTSSSHEAKEAANKACKWAFQALDRLEGNSCNGWRRAECRQLHLPEFDNFQCSCLVSYCNELEIRINEITAFRDCAWKVCAEEIWDQRTPAVSNKFQSIYQKFYLDAVSKFRQSRVERTASEAGTSRVPKRQRTKGIYSGTESKRGRRASQSLDVPIGADTSYCEDISPPPETQDPHICSVCGRQYVTKQILKDHQVSHLTDLRCKVCTKPFSTRGNLNLHMRSVHANIVKAERGLSVNPSPGSTYGVPGVYACDICEKSYRWKSSLVAHKKTHTESVRCDFCGTDYSTKASYKKHLKNKHRAIFKAVEAEENALRIIGKDHRCDQCGACFTAKKRLQEHMAVHRGETYCDQCDTTFARKAILNYHMKKEHSENK